MAPSWIACGDLDHLRRALVGGEHALHEQEPDDDGQSTAVPAREDEPEPLGTTELEDLVAALGCEDVETCIGDSLSVSRRDALARIGLASGPPLPGWATRSPAGRRVHSYGRRGDALPEV